MKINFFSVFTFLFCLAFSSLLYAEGNKTLYYILDGSGSMWGRAGGRTKIEAAKEVLNKLISEMPDNLLSGLTVYGHRRKGDCSDIEEVIPLGKIDRAAAKDKINSIKPKGMTPISDSIEFAVERVKGNEAGTTIVLVSDGIETCDKDPCKLTKSLKESGVNFVMHVVGFDVSDSAEKQLKCIAEAGGGQYFSAQNATALLKALTAVKESVVKEKPLPTPEPTPAPIKQKISSSSKSIRIKAKGPGRIKFKYQSWLKRPYQWQLLDPETGKVKASFNSLKEQMVPPGEYQLAWDQSEHGTSTVTLGEVFRIESGKVTEVPLLTAIQLRLPQWVKRPYNWGLIDPEADSIVALFRDIDQPFLVPAGEYDLFWHQAEHGSSRIKLKRVQIEQDKTNTVELSSALHLVRADWVPEELYYWAIRKPGRKKKIASFRLWEPQLVPPGEYEIVYRWREHGSSESPLGTVKVEEGRLAEFNINTGVKIIPPEGTEPPDGIWFVELDENGKRIGQVSIARTFGPIALKPGRYRIDYLQEEHGSSRVTIVDSFELPAGSLVEIEM
ncbi:MAG: VWA domain-containing protein [Candidatus Dadabacteria bacterium]|nr:MAG: VWA domain-containing protein [Candidatus Dadabacteria bacterium]